MKYIKKLLRILAITFLGACQLSGMFVLCMLFFCTVKDSNTILFSYIINNSIQNIGLLLTITIFVSIFGLNYLVGKNFLEMLTCNNN